jgi:dihydrofolate reductase
MRKLIVITFLTLDGVMQAPGGPGEDDDGGFSHGGWSMRYWDERMAHVIGKATSGSFDLLLGRRTYDILGAYWPHASEEEGAKPLNDATKYVVSRGRPALVWEPAVLIEGDAAAGIRALKEGAGPDVLVYGSGDLIQTLMRHDLVDRFHLWVFPVVLGAGKRLFSDGAVPAALTLVDSTVSSTGVVMGTYEPAGELVTDTIPRD